MEKDPTGKNPHELGAKLDAGKPCLFRGAIDYFPNAIEAVAGISTFGASKYAWKGWKTVPEGFERYSDAMVRHLISEGKGEVLDRDSGLLHAAHTAWNSLARLELLIKERENGIETSSTLGQKVSGVPAPGRDNRSGSRAALYEEMVGAASEQVV